MPQQIQTVGYNPVGDKGCRPRGGGGGGLTRPRSDQLGADSPVVGSR